MTTTTTNGYGNNNINNNNDKDVTIGPDLNESKSPLDKKLYRQILLPNGLRAVLISDVVAMHQAYNEGGIDGGFYDDDDDDDDDDDVDDMEEEKNPNSEEGDDEENDEDSDDGGLRDAAACVVVGAGSYFDPPECQGLAHFLEHLLFMGSKKYPKENDYAEFLNKHGGVENAYTEEEYTAYYFTIPQEFFQGALDRLAQFFVSPLLLTSSVERELEAIESEFQLKKNSDEWRLHSLWNTTCCNPQHPFSQFLPGNLNSLKEIPKSNNVDTLQHLRTFFNKYYYALNMRIAVVGAYSLDTLQSYVVDSFKDVPTCSRDSELDSPPLISWDTTYDSPLKRFGLPLNPNSFKLYHIVPVKDRHTLSISWQLPSQIGKWKTKVYDYISNLIGHEGKGSLLSSLKEKSWVISCYAGIGGGGIENSSFHAFFNVTFTLSQEGVSKWAAVTSEVYQYIGMLRHYGEDLPKWIYEEFRSIHEISYRFGDEPDPEDLVENIAENMVPHINMPPERLLDGNELWFEYDSKEVQHMLSCLTPYNARLDLMSSEYGQLTEYENTTTASSTTLANHSDVVLDAEIKFDPKTAGPPRIDCWFGTPYWVQDLSPTLLQRWTDMMAPQMPPADSMLGLPPKNPFVPEKFDLKPLPAEDCSHPLLNCSLKLCIVVGKKKQWFPATVTQFNSIKNEILLSYEDETEQWHKVDHHTSELTPTLLSDGNFEGTLDSKSIKYRMVAFALDGTGAVLKFGDESDLEVTEGKGFPAIPPALSASRLPRLVYDTRLLKLWHLQDRKFKRPIAELRMKLTCGRANATPLHRACAELLAELCVDALTETCYMASICELDYSIETTDSGFSMRVNGFDDKLVHCFCTVFEMLMSFRGRDDGQLPPTIKEERFKACLEMLRRKNANSGMASSKLSTDIRIQCLRPTFWSCFKKNKALEDITICSFAKTASEVLRNISVEALFHGNVNEADASELRTRIVSLMEKSGGGGLSRKKYPSLLVTKIPLTRQCFVIAAPSKDPTDSNTAVEVYFQIGKDNIRDRVVTDLLAQLMYEPLFDQVRTKDQFGYTVSCDARWTYGVMGLYFKIVTARRSALETTERIDKFLIDYRQTLVDMSTDDFVEQLAGLAKNKLDMFNSLSEETSTLWGEIREGTYDFEVKRNEAIALRNLTKGDVITAFDEWLNPNQQRRRMIVVQVISGGDGSSDACIGRPEVILENLGDYVDGKVHECIKKHCKEQTWGKIFS